MDILDSSAAARQLASAMQCITHMLSSCGTATTNQVLIAKLGSTAIRQINICWYIMEEPSTNDITDTT